MTIVFVTPEFITEPEVFDGGLSNYLYRVCKSLIQLGHNPIVLTRSFSSNETIDYQGIKVYRNLMLPNRKIALLKKLTFHKFDDSIDFQHISWTLNKRLEEILKSEPVDIIQYASYTATGLYRVKSKPAIVRISSYEKLHRQARGITNITLDERRIEQIEKLSLLKADSVYGPSKMTNQEIAKDLKINVETIESPFVMNEGALDDSVYKRELEDKKYVLFFGSMSRLKGTLVIADVLEEFLRNNPDWFFVFVGKDLGTKSTLLEKAGDYRQRVIFISQLPHPQLYPIIQNADFVTLPSLYDNFPNTCIEAMSLGSIVIGTFNTSFEQIIENNVNGVLVQVGSSEDLLHKMQYLTDLDDRIKKEMRHNAKKTSARLRPELVVNELLELYKNTIIKFNVTK